MARDGAVSTTPSSPVDVTGAGRVPYGARPRPLAGRGTPSESEWQRGRRLKIHGCPRHTHHGGDARPTGSQGRGRPAVKH